MAGLELNESTGDLDLGYLPDEWSVFHDYDRTHYVQDLDHNWFEKSLLSPLQLGISSYPTSVQKGLPAVLPNSMSLVHPRYTTSETSMSSLEDPRSRDPRPTSEHQQKRRPRSKPFKDGESAVEVNNTISFSSTLQCPVVTRETSKPSNLAVMLYCINQLSPSTLMPVTFHTSHNMLNVYSDAALKSGLPNKHIVAVKTPRKCLYKTSATTCAEL